MPYLALLCNSLVWGVAWWPLRTLQANGLHPLWATMVFFMVGSLCLSLWRPEAVGRVLREPRLWALAIATGFTNAAFNWGVSVGEVVRVVLLFYLMPLWAVGLAWWLLGERLRPAAMLRVVLALAGALLVLRPDDGGWPQFSGLADWLGLLGGMGFALTNVLLRREGQRPAGDRALAMFGGGLIMPAGLALALSSHGTIPGWPTLGTSTILFAVGTGGLFLLANLALQYGAARLPVRISAIVMLTEIVFASVSAVLIGGETLQANILVGGAFILAAAVLATQDKG